jgi:hypothetical protein
MMHQINGPREEMDSEPIVPCPGCGETRGHLLADGRTQCAGCRKKFSPVRRRGRLPEGVREAIVEGFLAMRPAHTVADDAGVNPKTVQHHFLRMREGIAADRERRLRDDHGGLLVQRSLFTLAAEGRVGRGAEPLCGILSKGGETRLLFASDETEDGCGRVRATDIQGWVYAVDPGALARLELDRIHHLSLCRTGDGSCLARDFWIRAKRWLTTYHGGFRTRFPLYLREMEFRVNRETMPDPRNYLKNVLEREHTTPTGEDNV